MPPNAVKERKRLAGQLGWKQCDLAAQGSLLGCGRGAHFVGLSGRAQDPVTHLTCMFLVSS